MKTRGEVLKRQANASTRSITCLMFTVFLSAMSFSCFPAHAGEADRVQTVETMTVTAHKRSQEARDVPDSITVLTDTKIEDASIRDMEALSYKVPGLTFNNFGSRRLSMTFMRGIKSMFTGEPATGVYVDGVNYAKSYMFDFPLFDVEHIEVLKGSQGTLYGKNTMAGVINIHTREPGNDTVARIGAEYGSENLMGINASVSGPIVRDRLFFGLAGAALSKDSYLENDTPAPGEDGRHAEGGGGRFKLRYTPGDNLDLRFTLDGQTHDGGALPLRRTERNALVKSGSLDVDPAYQYSHDFEGVAEDSFWGASLNADCRLGNHTLTWISGFRDYKDRESVDSDFSRFDMTRLNYAWDEETITQEVRLASPESGPGEVTWLAGVYYFHNDGDSSQEHLYRSGMSGNPYNPFGSDTGTRRFDFSGENHGGALFGQASIWLFKDFELTGGLRYEHQKATMERTRTDTPGSGGVTQLAYPDASNTFDTLLPKASLAWHLTPNHRVYATFSCGQRTGGFNTTTLPEYMAYDEEESRLYEIGTKLGFPAQRLALTLAGFYMDIDQEQITLFNVESNTPYIVNAGQSHRLGLEAELDWTLAPGLTLDAGLTLLEAEYDQYNDPALGTDYEGNRAFSVPNYTFSLGLGYRRPVWAGWDVMGRADLSGTGSRYFDDANRVREGAYELVNLKLGLEGDHLDVYVWAKNLLDRQYVVFENTSKGVAEDGAPRTLGVSVRYRF